MRLIPSLCTFTAACLLLAGAAFAQTTGPSSSESPYLVAVEPGVAITSVFTVGDSVNLKPDGVAPFRTAGVPDGLVTAADLQYYVNLWVVGCP